MLTRPHASNPFVMPMGTAIDGHDARLPAGLSGGVDVQVYLLFGKTGWLGGKLTTLLKEQGKTVHLADSRLENRESVMK